MPAGDVKRTITVDVKSKRSGADLTKIPGEIASVRRAAGASAGSAGLDRTANIRNNRLSKLTEQEELYSKRIVDRLKKRDESERRVRGIRSERVSDQFAARVGAHNAAELTRIKRMAQIRRERLYYETQGTELAREARASLGRELTAQHAAAKNKAELARVVALREAEEKRLLAATRLERRRARAAARNTIPPRLFSTQAGLSRFGIRGSDADNINNFRRTLTGGGGASGGGPPSGKSIPNGNFFNSVAAGAKKAHGEIFRFGRALTLSLARATALVAVFATFYTVVSTIRSATVESIKFIASLEDARLGAAAALASVSITVDKKTGEAVTAQQALTFAIVDSGKALALFKRDAADFGLPLEALIETFPIVSAATADLEVSLEKQVSLTEELVTLGIKLGVSQTQLKRTLDNIFKGQRLQQTELGRILFLTDKEVKAWREAGTLVDKLTERLAGVRLVIGENIDTLTGSIQSLKTEGLLLGEKIFGRAVEILKSKLRDIRGVVQGLGQDASFVESSSLKIANVFERILTVVENIIKSINDPAFISNLKLIAALLGGGALLGLSALAGASGVLTLGAAVAVGALGYGAYKTFRTPFEHERARSGLIEGKTIPDFNIVVPKAVSLINSIDPKGTIGAETDKFNAALKAIDQVRIVDSEFADILISKLSEKSEGLKERIARQGEEDSKATATADKILDLQEKIRDKELQLQDARLESLNSISSLINEIIFNTERLKLISDSLALDRFERQLDINLSGTRRTGSELSVANAELGRNLQIGAARRDLRVRELNQGSLESSATVSSEQGRQEVLFNILNGARENIKAAQNRTFSSEVDRLKNEDDISTFQLKEQAVLKDIAESRKNEVSSQFQIQEAQLSINDAMESYNLLIQEQNELWKDSRSIIVDVGSILSDSIIDALDGGANSFRDLGKRLGAAFIEPFIRETLDQKVGKLDFGFKKNLLGFLPGLGEPSGHSLGENLVKGYTEGSERQINLQNATSPQSATTPSARFNERIKSFFTGRKTAPTGSVFSSAGINAAATGLGIGGQGGNLFSLFNGGRLSAPAGGLSLAQNGAPVIEDQFGTRFAAPAGASPTGQGLNTPAVGGGTVTKSAIGNGQAALSAIPIIGLIIAAITSIIGGIQSAKKTFDNSKYQIGIGRNELSRKVVASFYGGAVGGILGDAAGGALADFGSTKAGSIVTGLIDPNSLAISLLAPKLGIFQPKTTGTIVKKSLNQLYKKGGIGRQNVFSEGGSSGVRAQFLELNLDPSDVGRFEQLGLKPGVTVSGRTISQATQNPIFSPLDDPRRPGELIGYRPNPQVEEIRRRRQPGVSELRFGPALAIATAFSDKEITIGAAANTITNNLVALGRDAENARRDLLRLASTMELELSSGLDNLSDDLAETHVNIDIIRASVSGLLDLFGELPRKTNFAAITNQFLPGDSRGLLTQQLLDYVDFYKGIADEIPNAIDAALQDGNLISGAEALADSFSKSFTERLFTQLVQKGEIGAVLGEATLLANSAIDALVRGDLRAFDTLSQKASQAFAKGRQDFLTQSGAILPSVTGFLNSIGVFPGGGLINPSGSGIPSFATNTQKIVPGPRGAPLLSVNHGAEVVTSPEYHMDTLSTLRRIEKNLSNQKIVFQPVMKVVVDMDGKEIAKNVIFLTEGANGQVGLPNAGVGI